jgi:hypothetical protein
MADFKYYAENDGLQVANTTAAAALEPESCHVLPAGVPCDWASDAEDKLCLWGVVPQTSFTNPGVCAVEVA